MILYIYILLRPWSTAQISQEQQDLGSWVVISFRVRDPKSDGCEVLPRMDFWGPSSKQFRGPQKKRSPTSRVLKMVIFHGYVSHNQMVITTRPDFWNHPNTSRNQGVCFYDLSPKLYKGDIQLGIGKNVSKEIINHPGLVYTNRSW